MLLNMNKLRKTRINIKKDIFILSVLIFFSENINLLFKTTFGLNRLYISMKKAFTKIQILINFNPDVVDKTEPPNNVNKMKNKPKLSGI